MIQKIALAENAFWGLPSRSATWVGFVCAAAASLAFGCGVPKDFVNQESIGAFHNTVDAAAHVKAKCGDQADIDNDCKQSMGKLEQLCQGLDELAKKAGGAGFDCAAWKERS